MTVELCNVVIILIFYKFSVSNFSKRKTNGPDCTQTIPFNLVQLHMLQKNSNKKCDKKLFIHSIIISEINKYTLCTHDPAYPDTLEDVHDKRVAHDMKTTDKQKQNEFDRGIS